MGGLFGAADTWIPGLTTENFYVICEKALLKQGFFVTGPLYATANNLSCLSYFVTHVCRRVQTERLSECELLLKWLRKDEN